MSEMIDYLSTWSLLKWVILVLVAGFIGQFGKMAAEALVRRAKRKREEREAREREDKIPDRVTGITADKKLVKAMSKMRKKEAKAKSKSTS